MHEKKRHSIDVWAVIEAAKTKPYGFMPFYPGSGLVYKYPHLILDTRSALKNIRDPRIFRL